MSERSVSQCRTDVNDSRDTLREDSLPSTAKQSLSELALLLVDLPEPSCAEPRSDEPISAVVEELADCEPSLMSVALPTFSRPMATSREALPMTSRPMATSQDALPMASRPMVASEDAEMAASASVIVDFSVVAEPTLSPVVPAASGAAAPRVRPQPPAIPVSRIYETVGGAPVPMSIDTGRRGATTRQAITPLPKGPPAGPSGLDQERAAWLVILAGSQHPLGHVFPLTFTRRTRYRIGGDPSCEVVIASPVVSREHAEIGFDTTLNSFFLADLGSTNGTYVQPPGMSLYQVSGTVPLRDNSLIWLGREQVRFSFRCY